jgi:hypothetical protein
MWRDVFGHGERLQAHEREINESRKHLQPHTHYATCRCYDLLLPRDLIALALWGWSFAGDTVTWRGERFLLKRGKLIRIQPKPAAST